MSAWSWPRNRVRLALVGLVVLVQALRYLVG